MKITRIEKNKKVFLPLLLEADPEEKAIDRYLDKSEVFAMQQEGKALCVAAVLPLNESDCELKNIAVVPAFQRQGYGKKLIDYVFACYGDCATLLVGTGDVPSSLTFYKKCGFADYGRDSFRRRNSCTA